MQETIKNSINNSVFDSVFNGTIMANLVGYAHQHITTQNSTTSIIPWDNTIPQNTEGDEWFNISYTPKLTSSNILLIGNFVLGTSVATNGRPAIACFDSLVGASAIYAEEDLIFNQYVAAVVPMRVFRQNTSTAARTYTVRFGVDAVDRTLYLNRAANAPKYGGVVTSSFEVFEIRP